MSAAKNTEYGSDNDNRLVPHEHTRLNWKNDAIPMSKDILIVITSYSRWNEPPRARHQITNELLRAGYTVLFVERPLYLKQLPRNVNKKRFWKESEKLFIYTPILLLWNRSFRSIFRLWQRYYLLKQIKAIIRRSGLPQKVCLFNFAYDYFALTASDYFIKKVYYCNDDFISPHEKKYRAIAANYEKLVSQNCDAVFTVHQTLFERLKRYNSNCYLSPLGAAAQYINQDAQFQKYDHNKIKVLYMGVIDERLNYEWLKYILNDYKIALTMIGPLRDIIEEINELENYPNFRRYPTIIGQELYNRMYDYNVCIAPQNKTERFQNKSALNKLFQYFVAGKPVVITDSPSLSVFNDKFIYRAVDEEDFLQKIIQAAEEDNDSLFRERIAFAKKNSWENRVKEILEILGL